MKDRIQRKANDLFYRYGIRSITMDEIATQLGASKKTLYQYFSDKAELVDAVIGEMIAQARKKCDNNAKESRDAIDELFSAIELVQEIFFDMNPSLIYDLEKFHPSAFKLFLDYRNVYLYQLIQANLERGIREELYRPEINTEIIAKFRLEAITIAFNPDVYPPRKFSIAEIQRTMMEHFLFGVASLKGYKLILKYQQERFKA